MASDISDWLDMMPSAVTFYARTGLDAAAKPTYSGTASGPYPCRIELKNQLVIDGRPGQQGREVMARGRIILGSTFIPKVEDRIVLPVEYIPVSPPMIAVNPIDDENGAHHTTIYIG